MLVWLRRLRDRDAVVAPGDGTTPVEIVDVRDVADFMVLAIERRLRGVFNLTGREMTFRDFLASCRSATHSEAELVWIPQSFLQQQGQQDWARDYPYFVPPSERPNFYRISSQKAFAAGWQTRPLRFTATEYLAYVHTLAHYVFEDPVPADQQDALVAKWAEFRKTPHAG